MGAPLYFFCFPALAGMFLSKMMPVWKKMFIFAACIVNY